MIDITRGLVREVSQVVILADFKSGKMKPDHQAQPSRRRVSISMCAGVLFAGLAAEHSQLGAEQGPCA